MRRSGRAIHGFVGKTFTDSLGPSAVVVAIGIALGILVAAALADHRWVRSGLLMGLALIPIVLRWPVIVPFGLYALLLPFDTIQAGFGMTLTKPIGALAIAVLAAASLVERRLRRPPATALWCGLLLIWGIGSAAWAIDPDLVFGRLPTLVGISVLYILAVSIVPCRTEFHWV